MRFRWLIVSSVLALLSLTDSFASSLDSVHVTCSIGTDTIPYDFTADHGTQVTGTLIVAFEIDATSAFADSLSLGTTNWGQISFKIDTQAKTIRNCTFIKYLSFNDGAPDNGGEFIARFDSLKYIIDSTGALIVKKGLYSGFRIWKVDYIKSLYRNVNEQGEQKDSGFYQDTVEMNLRILHFDRVQTKYGEVRDLVAEYMNAGTLLFSFHASIVYRSLEIFNSAGMLIERIPVKSNSEGLFWNNARLSEGIYFVRLGQDIIKVTVQ